MSQAKNEAVAQVSEDLKAQTFIELKKELEKGGDAITDTMKSILIQLEVEQRRWLLGYEIHFSSPQQDAAVKDKVYFWPNERKNALCYKTMDWINQVKTGEIHPEQFGRFISKEKKERFKQLLLSDKWMNELLPEGLFKPLLLLMTLCVEMNLTSKCKELIVDLKTLGPKRTAFEQSLIIFKGVMQQKLASLREQSNELFDLVRLRSVITPALASVMPEQAAKSSLPELVTTYCLADPKGECARFLTELYDLRQRTLNKFIQKIETELATLSVNGIIEIAKGERTAMESIGLDGFEAMVNFAESGVNFADSHQDQYKESIAPFGGYGLFDDTMKLRFAAKAPSPAVVPAAGEPSIVVPKLPKPVRAAAGGDVFSGLDGASMRKGMGW